MGCHRGRERQGKPAWPQGSGKKEALYTRIILNVRVPSVLKARKARGSGRMPLLKLLLPVAPARAGGVVKSVVNSEYLKNAIKCITSWIANLLSKQNSRFK